jgi:hypothetical protein
MSAVRGLADWVEAAGRKDRQPTLQVVAGRSDRLQPGDDGWSKNVPQRLGGEHGLSLSSKSAVAAPNAAPTRSFPSFV